MRPGPGGQGAGGPGGQGAGRMGGRRGAGAIAAAVLAATLCGATVIAQTPAKPGAKPAAAKPQTAAFDELVKKATDARQAQRWDEAVALYGRLAKMKPDFVEAHWYQGTAYYSLDDFPSCRAAFSRVVRLAPKNGAAHAF